MRESKTITIDKGRDTGKVFKVTEMAASRLEKWAARALCALFSGNLSPELQQQAKSSNAAALASAVLTGLGSVEWAKVEPLYDELLQCIARVPDPARPEQVVQLVPANIDAHCEDVGTLLKLRLAALEVNFAFFGGGSGLSSLIQQAVSPQTCETMRPSRPA